ncbi:MAG: hypothetical protein PHN31_03395 [Candidatus Gracilibacteria bacterium]|nr:hypothetical protein [Candidatus Gracilibacteria bacterium]
MIQIQKTIVGRFFQAIKIFFLSYRISLYYVLFLIVSGIILFIFGNYLTSLAFKFVNFSSVAGIDANSYINVGYFGIIYFFISISVIFLKLVFYISFIRNINDYSNINTLDINMNLKYGFLNLFKVFNTYVYIFNYVFLIPFLVLIFGLILLFINQLIGGLVLFFTLFIFLYFFIFRGLRSFLSIIHAIENDNYSKENFDKSLIVTRGNVGNIFLNLMFFYVLTSILSGLIFSFLDNNSSLYTIIYDIYNNKSNLVKIQSELANLKSSFDMSTWILLHKCLKIVYDSIFSTIGIIFYYLLLKNYENNYLYFNVNENN